MFVDGLEEARVAFQLRGRRDEKAFEVAVRRATTAQKPAGRRDAALRACQLLKDLARRTLAVALHEGDEPGRALALVGEALVQKERLMGDFVSLEALSFGLAIVCLTRPRKERTGALRAWRGASAAQTLTPRVVDLVNVTRLVDPRVPFVRAKGTPFGVRLERALRDGSAASVRAALGRSYRAYLTRDRWRRVEPMSWIPIEALIAAARLRGAAVQRHEEVEGNSLLLPKLWHAWRPRHWSAPLLRPELVELDRAVTSALL